MNISEILTGPWLELLLRLALDITFTLLIARGVYERYYHRQEYVFTYVVLNLITFSLSYILNQSSMELGFALGLFAVFGILRYRTEPIRTRDLTYLFVVIGLGLLNALAEVSDGLGVLLLTNGAILTVTVLLEASPGHGRLLSKKVLYDKIDLLSPQATLQLKEDLRVRTGLPVERVVVEGIDLLRDTATLTIYYPPARG
jgi:hypothetical protein